MSGVRLSGLMCDQGPIERLALIRRSIHVGTTFVAEVVSQHFDHVRREFLGIEIDVSARWCCLAISPEAASDWGFQPQIAG